MFSINWNDITISKGDTASFTAELYEDGEPYTLSSGDSLVLNAEKGGANVLHLTADSEATFTFAAADTASLAVGDYKYDIELTTAGGEVYHPIGMANLTIAPVAAEPEGE